MVNTGTGASGETHPVGIPTTEPGGCSGTPVGGGSVTIVGVAATGVSPGLTVNLGIGVGPANLPFIIYGGLTIVATGQGSANLGLNDLRVFHTTTIILTGTSNDTVSIQGSSVTSVLNGLNIFGSPGGSNTFNIQKQAGHLAFDGPVLMLLGSGDDTLNLAANAGSPGGVTNAEMDFFSSAIFNGGPGAKTLFQGRCYSESRRRTGQETRPPTAPRPTICLACTLTTAPLTVAASA